MAIMHSLDKRQQFSFTWGFDGGDASANIKTCTPITLFANRDAEENGTAAQPVPPYTVIAYPEQGIPTVDLLGSTAPYSWTPRFPAGTKILISVVDAVGNSGGVAQTTYVVNAGTSTSCVPATSDSGVQMTIDTSDSIQTCDTVPIRIQGGNQPYHLSIAATNSASAVNLTTTGSNDYYQWINRAAPGQSLIVAVSDSNGQYATTSKFYTTAGATDTSCPGKSDSQSVFGGGSSSAGGGPNTATSTSSTTSSTSTAAVSHKSKSLTGPIVGTIIALLVIFAAIAFWFFRKQKSRGNYDHSPITGSTGFGMKDYKRGENLPGNESFIPLADNASPVVPVTPLYGGDHSGGHSASGSFSGRPAQRPVSGFDYYSSPPSNYSGTVDSSGPSRMNTLSVSHGTSSSGRTGSAYGAAAAVGAGAAAAATATAAAHHSKRQMMLEEQQRQQRWPGANYVPPPPQSVYPPQSTYSADPFADPTYPQPYRMGLAAAAAAAPSVVVSEAPPPPPSSNIGSGYGYRPEAPTTYKASHTSRASGSQDGSQSSAAKAKAAEAAREREQQQQQQRTNVPSTIYDDDEDPIPYMQRSRPVLGVTNPDRASTATGVSADDAYGGMDRSRPSTQVYQHEDAGAVIELPPAYREYQPGGSEAGHTVGGGTNAPPRPS